MQRNWLCLIFAILVCLAAESRAAVTVKDGVLDLRGVSLDEPIMARGQWEFHWNQLLTPDTVTTATASKTYIKVPGLWNQGPADFPTLGYATYRMTVQLDQPKPIALFFPPGFWSSSRIFVGGKEIANFGVVGTDASRSSGAVGRKIYEFTPESTEFDVVVQIANFEIFLCGMVTPPHVGTLESITAMRSKSISIDLFVIGALFIMGMYHIVLYVLRTEDPSTVWFGVLCLSVAVYMAMAMDGALTIFFPNMPLPTRLRIFNMAWIAAVPSFVWFTSFVFRDKFSRRVCWAASAIALGYFVLITGTSHRIFVDIVNYFHAVTLVLVVYCFYAIGRACRSGAEGAWVFLGGVLIMAFTTVHDVLAIRQIVVSPPLTGLGLLGFIFFQSTMIAMRFSKAFTRVKISEQEIRGLSEDLKQEHAKVKALNNNLERLVDEKTRDIRSMMEHIPLGVFMIQTDHKIHKDHSRYMDSLFPQIDTEAMEATDIIFARSTLSADERNQATASIQGILGDDVVNFEANAHLLPLELREIIGSTERIFDLTWNAIETSTGEVDRILVTMRDVTDLRRLQERSREQQEELEFIGEILRIPAPRFLRFLRSCRDFIEENEKLIHSHGIEKRNLEILKVLFVNMHTVKGSARSLYLKKMSQVFHEIEQYYAHLQNHESAVWDVTKMAADLEEAKKIVALYETIAREKLGRSSEQNRLVEFPVDAIRSLYKRLQAATARKTLPQDLAEVITQIRMLLHVKIFKDAQLVFQEIFGCLPVLAKDLHKEIPAVQLETHGFLLSDQADELFRSIFVHLLRNAMDHGIETPAERLEVGKNAQGRITITMERQDTRMLLTYGDDGRGLHLSRIRDIGLKRGLLSAEEAHEPQNIANLIFDSGLSTANHVTDISGRGVGMDAVKRFIMRAGGHIRIQLLNPTNAAGDFYAFRFLVDLPFELFEEHPGDALKTLASVS
ncbi:7TM diverse intracellular signaling domain-containing protein [Oligoflexus tunisiensis]|uniref:7TM diverse intracellular signaling domain-containing protein n=1 Tax=Oligoflexus tunisiensis TaxID=708132 RepID=UPI000AD87C2D|nr:7TM diverse intracellular signaling domain-containing protein [Oligoflexus tunisiensis]